MLAMTRLRTMRRNGINYFNPRDVHQAKKDQYWLMTGQLLVGDRKLRAADTKDLVKVKAAFAKLSADEKGKILLQQRRELIRAQMNDPKQAELVNPLSWSFLRNGLDLLDKKGTLFSTYQNVSHSYKRKSIAGIFGKEDRLYLPMNQFLRYPIGKFSLTEKAQAKDEMIVLSRNAYDLARMSTQREWTSCMSMTGGNYDDYVPQDIKQGTLVAYVVDGPGKNPEAVDWNIAHPSTRCLFKPSYDNQGKVVYQRDSLFGARNNPFKHAANFLNREWFSRAGVVGKEYRLSELYNEGISRSFTFSEDHKPQKFGTEDVNQFAENLADFILEDRAASGLLRWSQREKIFPDKWAVA